MLNENKTYHKNISRALLLGYTFLFIFNIFHYHNIDIASGNYFLTEDAQTSNKITSSFNDLGNKCIFHVNYSSLHNINLQNSSKPFNSYFNEEKLLINSDHNFFDLIYNYSNPLRAPPAVSIISFS